MQKKKIALQVIEESLKELESPRGSILSAVQKLQRSASIAGDEEKRLWCSIQLGDSTYVHPLKDLTDFLVEHKDPSASDYKEGVLKHIKILEKLGLTQETHFTNEEINIKLDASGGGYVNIGFVEESYADLVRLKKGNDGTYYKNHLSNHLNYVKKKAHELASDLYQQLKFSGTVSNCFDLLRDAVDDKLLDLNPVISEQLMLAFKSVSSNKEEEWSQALTTCRRLIETLADELYPATNDNGNGRVLGKTQYVNRLWAFMDASIESKSNKDLAKAHVDFLGSWLEKINKLSNKGVHAELGQLEATKAVFHTYIMIADILEYMEEKSGTTGKPDINLASIDEIEALLAVNRNVAKEIFKFRVKEGVLDCESLSKIAGVGPKTIQKAKQEFTIDE
ncbi:helix-hairpin-helix domain-containing protein [Methylophaga thalassica]|uniref:helix-hairpin-helix domain-containing protein n=1 Tax=Methylophaga TaxID=40222 RepID=UPI002E7BFAAB|nr:helix-hairpin-helix domain-containing protein [Methylophaga thalassica]WVI86378.1 helix-hairpin-helix domain-containing protein [Methylophaga thalassica]